MRFLRLVVVGFGPAGMFAGLFARQRGAAPGSSWAQRRGGGSAGRRAALLADARFDGECNVQFGEGGAGTFSDGKLNTGTRTRIFFETANSSRRARRAGRLLFDAKPYRHGTGCRRPCARSARRDQNPSAWHGALTRQWRTCSCGTARCRASCSSGGGARETLETRHVVLAVGHSARDTFNMLCAKACIPDGAEALSVGARIEHRAEMIDRAQYGAFCRHPQLGAADYKLSVHLENGRGVYTFCMCPGGSVVGRGPPRRAASSQTA